MRLIVHAGMLISLCCAVLAAGPVSPAKTAPTYKIVLERPGKVGEKYNIAVTGAEESRMSASMNGKVLENETDTFAMRLEGTVEVLEVGPAKQPLKESLTIAACVKIDGKDEVTLAPNGAVVIITASDEGTQYTIGGKPVGEELEKALSLAIALSTDDTTDDDAFGTKKPQRVGSSWDVNAKTIAAALTEEGGGTFEAKHITGKTTLKEALTVGGVPCLRIAADARIGKFTPPEDFPADLRVTTATLSLALSGLFPVDPAQQPLEDREEFTMTIIAEGKPAPDAPLLTISMTMTSTATTKYSAAE